MKTFKYIIIVSISLILLSSCGDSWLNLESSTSLNTKESIKSVKDIDYSLNGTYLKIKSSSSYSGRMMYYGDATGDDVQAFYSTKRIGSAYLFQYNRESSPSSYWSIPYSVIRSCNTILANIDNLNDKDKLDTRLNDFKGQAHALRALCLFDVTRIYGYPYLKDNGKSLGGVIVKDVLPLTSKLPRNTVAECYAEVISDLETAITLLDVKHNKGKINRWAAMNLLSRVYLYKGDNEKALAVAEQAIAGAEKSGFALWSNEEYPKAWGDNPSGNKLGEVLFELVNITTESPGAESMGYLCSYDGYQDMILTSSFVSIMEKDPKDVRNKAYVIKRGRAYINKYQPQEGETIQNANIPVYRLSELYLNAAEAAVKMNKKDVAVKYLNSIVKRANPNNDISAEAITLEKVLEERRKEFFGEGHRMFDVMRNNLRIERLDVANPKLKNTAHLDQLKESLSFDWNYHKIVLPIPKYEMDANHVMSEKNQQNPGY